MFDKTDKTDREELVAIVRDDKRPAVATGAICRMEVQYTDQPDRPWRDGWWAHTPGAGWVPLHFDSNGSPYVYGGA